MNIKRFTANKEWVEFVYNNREQENYTHPYDIVIGPIADRKIQIHFAKIQLKEKTFKEIVKDIKLIDLKGCNIVSVQKRLLINLHIMNVIETLISTSVDKMVYKLMHDYNATYDWAVKSVLASETYQRLLKDESFRNETPLYVYQLLIEEFVKAGILDIDDKTKAPR